MSHASIKENNEAQQQTALCQSCQRWTCLHQLYGYDDGTMKTTVTFWSDAPRLQFMSSMFLGKSEIQKLQKPWTIETVDRGHASQVWSSFQPSHPQCGPDVTHIPNTLEDSVFLRRLTGQSEWCQVYGDVVLLAGQFTGVALQVVSVTSIFRHPLHLVATVGIRRHPRSTALRKQIFHFSFTCKYSRGFWFK